MNYLQTFEQTIEAITPFLLFVTAFGTFLAAIGSLAAASFTLKTVRQAEQSRRAQVLIEAAHRYNDVYVKRAELMKRNLTWDDFRQKYDTPIKRLTSSEWADL